MAEQRADAALQSMDGERRSPKPLSAPADPLERFSRGAIGRKDAMSALGVEYGALFDLLVERGLSLPTLPDDELERMVEDMNRVLDEAGR